jgi:hypothetical protein
MVTMPKMLEKNKPFESSGRVVNSTRTPIEIKSLKQSL